MVAFVLGSAVHTKRDRRSRAIFNTEAMRFMLTGWSPQKTSWRRAGAFSRKWLRGPVVISRQTQPVLRKNILLWVETHIALRFLGKRDRPGGIRAGKTRRTIYSAPRWCVRVGLHSTRPSGGYPFVACAIGNGLRIASGLAFASDLAEGT